MRYHIGHRYLGDRAPLPVQDFVESGESVLCSCPGMPHLAVLKVNSRLLPLRSGEFEHRGRSANAFELDNVCNVQVAQGPLKCLLSPLTGRSEKRLHQHDEIGSRKWLLQKMNRPQACYL